MRSWVYNTAYYCDHGKQIGDNYGVSCSRCGQVLEGFGFGGFFGATLTDAETCIHQAWYKISENEEECLYCHEQRHISTN